MITREQAEDIRAREKALSTWVDTIRDPRSGWASYRPEDKPAGVPDVSNEERSALEVYDFCDKPPVSYCLYIRERDMTAVTWTGEKLGSVSFGAPWRDSFGGRRVPVTIRAINGCTYHGTYYTSSGDYARVKMSKADQRRLGLGK